MAQYFLGINAVRDGIRERVVYEEIELEDGLFSAQSSDYLVIEQGKAFMQALPANINYSLWVRVGHPEFDRHSTPIHRSERIAEIA